MSRPDSTRLRELLNYDPDTGVFTARVSRGAIPAGKPIGTVRRDGYLECSVDRRLYLLHRLAWCYVYGDWPTGELDHINGIKSDNRISNLRMVSRKQNMQNQQRPQRGNPYLGVSWHKKAAKWAAQIVVDRKHKHLGLFETPEDAREAYLQAKAGLHPFSNPERTT